MYNVLVEITKSRLLTVGDTPSIISSLKVVDENFFTVKISLSTVHVVLCTHFIRITFCLCIQTFGQGTRLFWMERTSREDTACPKN